MDRPLAEIQMLINAANEDSEGNEKHSRENINCLRLYLNHQEQTVGRNMGVKGAAVEGSEGNEEHVIGNWRKGGSCYIVAES